MKSILFSLVILGILTPTLVFSTPKFAKPEESHGTKIEKGNNYVNRTDEMRRQSQDMYALLYAIKNKSTAPVNSSAGSLGQSRHQQRH